MERCLRWAAVSVCLATGAKALLHDLPLRALLWDAAWWTWFANAAGYSWTEWVTDPAVDQSINGLNLGLGLLLLAVAALLAFGRSRAVGVAVVLATILLLLQHFLIAKEAFWQLGQVLELGLQTGAPLIWYAYIKGPRGEAYWRWVRWVVATTFVGHGLYAVGFHPVPANFVLMTQAGFGVGEALARQLLISVGILDFLAAFFLVLPFRRAQWLALCWLLPWALLTTVARLWSYGGLVGMGTLLRQWLPEVVLRLPHLLVPLAFALARHFWQIGARTQVLPPDPPKGGVRTKEQGKA